MSSMLLVEAVEAVCSLIVRRVLAADALILAKAKIKQSFVLFKNTNFKLQASPHCASNWLTFDAVAQIVAVVAAAEALRYASRQP